MINRKLFLVLLLLKTLTGFSQLVKDTVISSHRFGPLYSLPFTPVKDQYLSSTCWSFSSLSLLESELIKAGKGETDLSEMFVARYSMLRKIERHLQLKGSNFFTPGGQFHDVVWVMKHYGLMPEDAFSGKPRKEANHNHSLMDTVLSRLVKKWVQEGVTELDTTRRKKVEQLLDLYYGKIPEQFIYKGKTWTPRSFVSEYLGINPDDYWEITSYSHHPFYTRFILEDKYNWTGDSYYNVPLTDFMRITNTALDKGYTVGWDGDADDAHFDYNAALAWLPAMAKGKEQAQRQSAFETQTTLLNHMMHVVGRRSDDAGKNWYYIKNSWGAGSNPVGGLLYMNEDYFALRTVAIIVNKKAIPADIVQRFSKRSSQK